MLHLLLGRAGSGKSHWIRDFLAGRAREGKRDMVLLVPEQFSFESERALLRRLHTSPAGQIEVLSFSRLATRVFQQAGGFAGRQLDDAGRIILMGMATDEVRDRLQVYSRMSATAGFAGEMLGAVREWQQCSPRPPPGWRRGYCAGSWRICRCYTALTPRWWRKAMSTLPASSTDCTKHC